MIKLKSLLSELKVSRLGSDETYFVAWKDRLFLFGDDATEEDLLSIYDHFSHHPHFEKVERWLKKPLSDNLGTFLSFLSDFPQDVVTGYYYPERREIMLAGYEKGNPLTSLILPKIVRALNVNKVTKDYGDDEQTTYQKKQMKGQIPSVAYHGTNSENLEYILTEGLNPGRGSSNFSQQGIYHTDEIFFAASFEDAKFYSQNSVENSYKEHSVYQVILEINIPDKSLVVPDFDADATATSNPALQHYLHGKSNVAPSSLKPMSASLEVGKFGYRGRILPQQIRWVWLFNSNTQKWKKLKPSTVRAGLQRFGSDWYYHIGLGYD